MNHLTCKPPVFFRSPDTCGMKIEVESSIITETLVTCGFFLTVAHAGAAALHLGYGNYKKVAFHSVVALTCGAAVYGSAIFTSDEFPKTLLNVSLRYLSNVFIVGILARDLYHNRNGGAGALAPPPGLPPKMG